MIKGLVDLAWYGTYSGAGFGDIISSWESLGVFEFMLPFLLIFALIFGILSKLNLFGDKSKTVNAIVAFSVGLMALRFNIVSDFFSDIFPRLGIALSGVLVFLVILGLFADKKNRGLLNTLMWGSFGVALIIVLSSTRAFGFGAGDLWGFIPDWVVPIIVLIILMAILMAPKDKSDRQDVQSIFAKALGD